MSTVHLHSLNSPSLLHSLLSSVAVVVRALSIIVQQFLNKINMRQNHPPTAIPLQSKLVERVTLRHVGLEEREIRLPFVAGYFAARETADGDDH